MQRSRFVFCVALLVVIGAAESRSETLAQRMHEYVRRYVDAGLFSGVVLVSKGGGVVYEEAFGWAERGLRVPNTMQTKFHIASVSKAMTAVAVLVLMENGQLSLEDQVAKYVPDFPGGDKITIEQLLTHYSGLGDASAGPDYNEWSRFPQTPASLVEKARKVSPVSTPGTRYFYSNSNYHLLAFIIEKVSGLPYGDFLSHKIFKPAGMSDTGHRAKAEKIVADLANGYAPVGSSDFERATYLDWTSKTGNGSVYSTAGDLLLFDCALEEGLFLKPGTATQSYGFGRKTWKRECSGFRGKGLAIDLFT